MIEQTPDGNIELTLPKVNRKLLDKHHTYTLILQHNFTKQVHILKVKDRKWHDQFTVSRNPLRFYFEICRPDSFEPGEYTYYICSYDDWNQLNIDTNNIKEATIKERNEVLINGIGLLVNGNVLVHRSLTGILVSNDQVVLNDGLPLLITTTQEDLPGTGNLYRELVVISTGILKYKENGSTSPQPIQPESESDNYLQYEG